MIELDVSRAQTLTGAELYKYLNSETAMCSLAWLHLHVTTSGSIGLCCLTTEPKRVSFYRKDGTKYRLSDTDFLEYKHSEEMDNIQKSMMRGELPESCSTCKSIESNGGFSKRRTANKYFAQYLNFDDLSISHPNKTIDLRLGNLCNLACTMCSPWSSSTWANEKAAKKNITITKVNPRTTWPNSPQVVKNLLPVMREAESIYFAGGEPFMHNQHYDLLSSLIDSGHASKIVLKYTTNGTISIDKYIPLWQKFQKVVVGVSVDGIGELNNYIRYPSEWEVIEHTLVTLANMDVVNKYIEVQVSVQSLNFLNLRQIVLATKNISSNIGLNFHPVFTPDKFNICNLSDDLKDAGIAQLQYTMSEFPELSTVLQSIINFCVSSERNNESWQDLVLSVADIDKNRRVPLADIVPELAASLKL